MGEFRAYIIDAQDRIRSGEHIEAEGLDGAIDQALAMLADHPHDYSIEVWQGALRLYASRAQPPRHQCHVYQGAPSQTLPMMATLVRRKLQENLRCLYLNSPAMVAGLRAHLSSAGLDVEREVLRGALVLSSDQSHLEAGRFDADRMLAMLEDALDRALADGYAGLWASGDMGWELGPQPRAEALLDYEWRLEEIFRRRPQLSGICQYHVDTLPRDAVVHGVAAHRSAFVNETLSRLNPHFLAPFGEGEPHAAVDDMLDELCVRADA